MTCTFEGSSMRRACNEGRSGDWENYLKEFQEGGRLSVWASVNVSECHNEVEAEDEGWIRHCARYSA